MITSEELSKMNLLEIAQAIELHHQETTLLYSAMAEKISKKTDGVKSMSDAKVAVAEYYFGVSKDHPEVLPANFDFKGFEDSAICFKVVVDAKSQGDDAKIILKSPRDISSQDSAAFVSQVRNRIKELSSDPIFKQILQKEPSPRQVKVKLGLKKLRKSGKTLSMPPMA